MGLSFRMLVEKTNEHAIFALDREGHVASWNDGAEKIKGIQQKRLSASTYRAFTRPRILNVATRQIY